MSYDLALWRGPRPADDEAAAEEFERLADAAEEKELPSTQAVHELAAALVERCGDDSGGVWATWPPESDSSGDYMYLNLTLDEGAAAVAKIALTARRMGFVCYDPQLEKML